MGRRGESLARPDTNYVLLVQGERKRYAPLVASFTSPLNSSPAKVLMDTGCWVSTISLSLYTSHFSDQPIDDTRRAELMGASASFKTLGAITTEIMFTGRTPDRRVRTVTIPVSLQVTDNMIGGDALIGTDIMVPERVLIDVAKGSFILANRGFVEVQGVTRSPSGR